MDNGTKAPRQRQRDTAGAWLDEADDQRTARIGPPREIPGAPRYWGRRRAS